MKFDVRVLRVWLAGAVFGAGATFLFDTDNTRVQYVFFALLIGWVLVSIISRTTGQGDTGAQGRRRK